MKDGRAEQAFMLRTRGGGVPRRSRVRERQKGREQEEGEKRREAEEEEEEDKKERKQEERRNNPLTGKSQPAFREPKTRPRRYTASQWQSLSYTARRCLSVSLQRASVTTSITSLSRRFVRRRRLRGI